MTQARSLGVPRLGWIALATGCFLLSASHLNADDFSYSETFSLFGQTPNTTCDASPKGICGAVATINSFIYLEKQYPSLYGNKLTPNLSGNSDPTDALNFASNGFGTYQGYYKRPGDAYSDFLQTKKDWFTLYAPGTTTFEARYAGSGGVPDVNWLAAQVKAGQDVEFFVQATGFFHVLTLTGVSCTAGNCSITYQDPNAPATNQNSGTLTSTLSGLQFTNVPGSGFNGTVTITGAFAESPIPEPATWLLLGGGLALMARLRRVS